VVKAIAEEKHATMSAQETKLASKSVNGDMEEGSKKEAVDSSESSDTLIEEGFDDDGADSWHGGDPRVMAVCESTSPSLVALLRDRRMCDVVLVAKLGEGTVQDSGDKEDGEWEVIAQPELEQHLLGGLDDEYEEDANTFSTQQGVEETQAGLIPVHRVVVASFSSKLRRSIEAVAVQRDAMDGDGGRHSLRVELDCDVATLRVLVSYMYGGLAYLEELFRASVLRSAESFGPDLIMRLISHGCVLLDDPDSLVRWCCGVLNHTLTLSNAISVLHTSSLVMAGPSLSGMRLLHMLSARFVLQHWADLMPTPAASTFRSSSVVHGDSEDAAPSGPQQLLDDALRALGCISRDGEA
jgi:hypothetical protein